MDWVAMLKQEFGPKFKAKGLALCPANSYMWTEGNIASEIALETPGIDSLDIVYLGDSQVSEASTASFLRMCTNPQYYLANNELVMWPYATNYTVTVPGEVRTFNALPWSGGGEPLWYQDDPRVRNCSTLVSFRNQQLFAGVFGLLQKFEAECRQLPHAEREATTNAWGAGITTSEPPRGNPSLNRCVLACHGRGDTASVEVILRGNSPYARTGVRQLAAAHAKDVSVVVLEKGSEPGAHILSGAVMDARAITELFPNWKELGAPLNQPVTGDDVLFLSATGATRTPDWLVPLPM